MWTLFSNEYSVCWKGDGVLASEDNILDWSSQQMRERVEKMVFEYEEEKGENEEPDVATSAMIQALVSLSEPVGHRAKGRQAEASATRWNFSDAYFRHAAKFNGNHVSDSVDIDSALQGDPRSFDAFALDTEKVRRCTRNV